MMASVKQGECCPVCAGSTHFFHRDRRRSYFSCLNCSAVHVPSSFRLSDKKEKQEYDKHENNVDDLGYRQFLKRLADPLVQKIPPFAKGLDFGCGPGPALAHMLREQGFEVSLYDKFYATDERALQDQYQFITATEVVEHLADPRNVLDLLWQRLLPGGVLGIMTKRVKDETAFSVWHYKNDPTHIVFFHENTFTWLADQWKAKLEIVSADVVFFTKP